ncbi:MAG: hypothetical protein HY738_14510 [Bacteroidia bacterium]|nr:hypothetical protein [Bacteroidia bacterium]
MQRYNTIISKLSYCSLLFVVILLPLFRKLVPYSIGLWVIFWLLEGRFKERFALIKNKFLFWLMIGFYLLHAIGLLYSDNLNSGLFDLEVKFSLLLMPVLFAGTMLSIEKFNGILLTFVLGNIVSLLICSSGIVINLIICPKTDILYQSFSILLHPSYFSMYIIMAIVILLYFLQNKIYTKNTIVFYSFIILIIGFVFSLYMISSKAGIITGFIVLAIIFIFNIFKFKYT